MVSDQAIAQLQLLVADLVASKADEDKKTEVSNADDSAAAQAAAKAAQSKLDELNATARTVQTLDAVRIFVDDLASPPPLPPAQ